MIQEKFISSVLQHLAEIDRDINNFTLRLERNDLLPDLRRINIEMLEQAKRVRITVNESMEIYYANNIDIDHILADLQSN